MSRELLKTNVELPDRELVLLADKIEWIRGRF